MIKRSTLLRKYPKKKFISFSIESTYVLKFFRKKTCLTLKILIVNFFSMNKGLEYEFDSSGDELLDGSVNTSFNDSSILKE